MNVQALKEFIEESKKMWKVLRKPSKEEVENMVKVTLLSIFVIGIIGYVILEAVNYLRMLLKFAF